MELIKQRCDLIMEGKKFPSILIFPEGTTTNGKYIITFKKGAFTHMFPVKIFCLKYDTRYLIKFKKKRNFHPAVEPLNPLLHFILTLC